MLTTGQCIIIAALIVAGAIMLGAACVAAMVPLAGTGRYGLKEAAAARRAGMAERARRN